MSEVLYVNIYKRKIMDSTGKKTGEKLSMCALHTKEVAERFEAMRCKKPYEDGGAKRVACIRVDVNTLCIEGRYDN